jgi:putative protease
LDAGLEHYRLEFVHETADQVINVAEAFAETLNGKLDDDALRKRLQQASSEGITQGSLFVPENYLEIPQMG